MDTKTAINGFSVVGHFVFSAIRQIYEWMYSCLYGVIFHHQLILQKKIEEERLAKEEAERIAKEEAERKAKEEAERIAKEEAERKAKEEAERKAKEEAERIAKEEAERKAKEEAERKAKEPKYKYNSSNPFNGILNHLNKITNGNIQINQTIDVTSTCLSCGNYETLFDFENVNGHSHIAGNPRWLKFDFKNRKLQIDSYLIKSAHTDEDSHSSYYLKSWKVEISMDGNEWNTIDERINDSELNGNYNMHLFKLNQMSDPFRFIRIFSDQQNWANSDDFTIGKIEFFGNIIE